MIVLGLAAAAAWMVWQTVNKGDAKTAQAKPAQPQIRPVSSGTPTSEILNAQGLPFDNGWRYYSDGTSIGPDGSYYFGGQRIWTPD